MCTHSKWANEQMLKTELRIHEQELDSHVFKETGAQWLDYNINNKKSA